MRDEVTNSRPSALSGLFRKHANRNDGILRDWTRHLDIDWVFYCPECNKQVILIEEKKSGAAENYWTVTRRAATRHEDRPWGWRVTWHPDGQFSVTAARNGENGHQSVGETFMDEETLVATIVAKFKDHYKLEGHRLPDWLETK
jgi:hypothetical protein